MIKTRHVGFLGILAEGGRNGLRIDEIIYKTLIAGDSYRTLLKGLWVTFQISLLSLLLGTLLGVAVCAMRRSRFRLVRSIAAVYMAVVRGSPVLLLLMLMYYVVFAGSNVSPVMVAVAAFSLHMSAYTAACFYSPSTRRTPCRSKRRGLSDFPDGRRLP